MAVEPWVCRGGGGRREQGGAGRVPRPTTLAPKRIREHPWHLTGCPIISLSLVETLLEPQRAHGFELTLQIPMPHHHNLLAAMM